MTRNEAGMLAAEALNKVGDGWKRMLTTDEAMRLVMNMGDLVYETASQADSAAFARGVGEAGGWTETPPTEQNVYWHWNGDTDCAPLPMFVLYSGTTRKCFVSRGQLGIERAVDCEAYGGWWKPLPTPAVPDADAIRRRAQREAP